MDAYLKGKKIKLKPSMTIGKGGEADIYDIGNGQALKIFKGPDHPDYAGLTPDQQAARERLAAHQQKLPQFPTRLPANVLTPQALAMDYNGRQIIGYAMRLLNNAEVLNRYADRMFRQAGVPIETLLRLFLNLHQTVRGIHEAGVIIGDFNDLNVMVEGENVFMIDADSFQFGRFYCQVFTSRFVDPLCCALQNGQMMLARPHGPDSDWYAFAVMLMQCLLFVDPYGGVYRPKDPAQRLTNEARPMQRITVFHPDVRYPKPAVPYQVLPDDLLQQFHLIFEKDRRGEFPARLIEDLRWTSCPNCGTEHARSVCPTCAQASPLAVKSVTMIRGQVIATRIFHTSGQIVFAAWQGDTLRWLYHENGVFKRENEAVALHGELDPRMRFRLCQKETLIGYHGQLAILGPERSGPERLSVDSFGTLPVFDANERYYYRAHNGQLLRNGVFGPEYVGDVLVGQTQFWVGPRFGFGFYRAGDLSVAFVFHAEQAGINDRVKLSPMRGQLLDSSCVFSRERCWFLAAWQQRGRTIHTVAVIRADGTVEATLEEEAVSGAWFSTLRGKCAVGNFLLAATDEGVVRVDCNNGRIQQTRAFPDTEPFVHSGSHLFAAADGLYVVKRREILHLKLQ